MTPLLNPITPGEQHYNQSHIRTRNTVERLFGVLKKRFPILAYGCRLKIDTFLTIIVACSVLHNIAIDVGDIEAPPLPQELNEHILNNLIMNGQVPVIGNADDNIGAATRRQFVNYFQQQI